MPDKGWQRPFDDPVPLPRGRQLVTPRDAAEFITKLPKADHDAPEWQAAMEALLCVGEFNPDRKDPHWGRRKLKRDE